MTIVSSVALLLVAFVVLARAADQFVTGAARIAAIARVSPVVIGAVVIGFGTSSPELLVSGLAAWEGHRDIAVGNIVGSNVANIALVVAVAALVTPLTVTAATWRREAAISASAVAVFAVLVQDSLNRIEGVVLLLLLAAALAAIVRGARFGPRYADDPLDATSASPLRPHREARRVVVALALTLASAHVIVVSAGSLADELGVEEGFIGLSLVAVGTTLPELVTAIQASRRNQGSLVVGNVLGSNIFNSLAVGGVVALLSPGRIADPSLTGLATGAMVAVAVIGWLLMGTGRRVTRVEGAVLLMAYAGFLPLLART